MTDESVSRDPDIAAEIQYRLIERLAASERQYREILEGLPEIVLMLDAEGRIQFANEAWERLLGFELPEGDDSSVISHILQEDRRKWNELLAAANTIDDEPSDRLVRFMAADGRALWMNVRIRWLESGECVCALEDFTTRRRLEAELVKSQRLESIGRLAGGLAHDFNNFLTIILGNINIAQAKLGGSPVVNEELEIAAKACMHASGVTRQMLTFSKGGAPVTRSASIVELVKEAAELTLRGSKTRAILDIDETVPAVEMDVGQIHQVFGNLMLNADQAMPEGGTLTITIRSGQVPAIGSNEGDREAVVVELRDQGVGIPLDDIDRVFDPYFTTKDDGSGLGLTSAFWILQRHEGLLELDSRPGEGTTVRVSLPVGSATEDDRTDSGAAPAMKGKARILVMDDHDLVRRALQAMLETLGHDVEMVEDGEQCVDRYIAARDSGDPHDLVILDLTVPGGRGGVWTMEKLLKINPDVKAIVASGYGSDPVIASHRAYGFTGRIQKPFRIEELRKVINVTLGCSRGEFEGG